MSSTDPQPLHARALGLIRRTLRKRRWPIMTRWALLTVALLCAVYVMPPTGTYQARSLLRADPLESRLIYVRGGGDFLESYIQSQVELITSPEVLTAAGTNSKVAALSRIKAVGDVAQELREAVSVAVIPNTYLIEVSMTSRDPVEAATIVDAVVDAFLKASSEGADSMTRQQINNLEQYSIDLKSQIDKLERHWKHFVTKAKLDIPIERDLKDLPDYVIERIKEYRLLHKQLNEIKLELALAQAWLTTAKFALNKVGKAALPDQQAFIEEQIKRMFGLDPEAIALKTQVFEANAKLEEARRLSNQPNDPTTKAAKSKLDALTSQWHQLWDARSLVIREQIEFGDGGKPLGPVREIREAAASVNRLLAKQAALKEQFDMLDVRDNKMTGADDIALLQDARATLTAIQGQVTHRLEQLRYEAKDEARIRAVSPNGAIVPTRPIRDRRPLYMAIIPFATFALVLAFFTGVEARSGAKPKVEALDAASLD
jgi:polysaccharide biosynthesis transport protein